VRRQKLHDQSCCASVEVYERRFATIPSGLDRKEAELYSQLDPHQFPNSRDNPWTAWPLGQTPPSAAYRRPRKGVDQSENVVTTRVQHRFARAHAVCFFSGNFTRRPRQNKFSDEAAAIAYLKNELPLMHRNNIRLSFIGRSHMLPQEVQERMAWPKNKLAHHTGMVMTLALNSIALRDRGRLQIHGERRGQQCGLDHLKIDEESLNRHMYTSNLPELDLIIRTSGEMRLSKLSAMAGGICGDLRDKTLGQTSVGCICWKPSKNFSRASGAMAA